MERSGRRVGALAAVASALLFALSVPTVKRWLPDASPVALSGLLYLGAGLGLWLSRLARRRSVEAPLTRRDLGPLALVVLSGGILAPTAIFFGLKSTAASEASLLTGLEGVATVLVARVVFGEAVASRIWAAAVFVTAASLCLTLEHGIHLSLARGPALIALGTTLWAFDSNWSRLLAARDPVSVSCAKGLAAGAFNTLLALAMGATFPDAARTCLALGLGFASYGASLVLYMRGLRDLGTARTAALFGLAPFIGALLSLLLLQEPLSLRLLVAGLLMAVGSILVLGEQHGHLHEHDLLEHEHRHVHDAHHQHDHDGIEGPEPHSHPHLHGGLVHAHRHDPDIHHRHSH